MTYKFESVGPGYPPIEAVIPSITTLATFAFDQGDIVSARDRVWGGGEFVMARAAAAIRAWGVVKLLPVWDATAQAYRWDAYEMDVAANSGRTLAVAPGVAMTAGQFGWFMLSGNTPVNCNASIAADAAVGLSSAGQAGAVTAGRQMMGTRAVTASTQAVSKVAYGDNGDTRINVKDTDGLILGGFLSGSGVGASAVITFIDPMGKYIIASVANTAAITGTSVTCTYNNGTTFYNIVHMTRPMAQGQTT